MIHEYESFLDIKWKKLLLFGKINADQVVEHLFDRDKFEVFEILVGDTHNIKNLVDAGMVTVMRVNEKSRVYNLWKHKNTLFESFRTLIIRWCFYND